MALDRWQQQLCDLLTAVHRKQQQYDQAARACQVLLKPWPKKSREEESAAKKDIPDNIAADPPVNPHEEAELKMVNDLLKRAQKTRVKTTSKKQKEQICTADDDLPSSRSAKDLWEVCDSTTPTNQESAVTGDAHSSISKPAPVTKTDSGVRKNTGSSQSESSTKTAVKKQHQRIQPGRERRDQSSHPVTKHHSSVSSVAKPVPALDQKRSKSSDSIETSRPPSRPRSSRGGFKPAHTTAPFKTDPTLQVPKRSAKNSIRPIKQQPASKRQNYTGDRNYTSKVLPPISSEKDASPSSMSNIEKDSALAEVCDTHSQLTDRESQSEIEHQTSLSHEETLNSKLSGMTLATDSTQDVSGQRHGVGVKATHPEGASSNSEENPETKLFSLLSNGSSITIPAKVRRAFAKNQQLRKKLSQKMSQQDTGRKPKSDGTSMGQKFADKLQQLFDPEEELLYRRQALECLHTHQQLLHLLTQLNLDQLTEASSAGEILRAKMLAEFVLSSFSAFSEEVNFFSKVQFPDTPKVVEPPHKQVGHPYLWLPTSLQGDLCSETGERLQYSSKKDLNRYTSVLLQLQTLKCQHHLLDILVNDILPWLQQQDCHQEDFGAVFRGLFALLTSDGSQAPVLIRDSVQ